MLSRINIKSGDDYKPVIKVLEVSSDDARDDLVTKFRELLKHTSSTLTVRHDWETPNGSSNRMMIISPVSNELEYFHKRLIWIHTMPEGIDEYKKKRIDDFFEFMRDPNLRPSDIIGD